MRFSYVMLPDYPLSDSIEAIKTADELGFHGCYSVDETWHKDMWLSSPRLQTRRRTSASGRASHRSACASRH